MRKQVNGLCCRHRCCLPRKWWCSRQPTHLRTQRTGAASQCLPKTCAGHGWTVSRPSSDLTLCKSSATFFLSVCSFWSFEWVSFNCVLSCRNKGTEGLFGYEERLWKNVLLWAMMRLCVFHYYVHFDEAFKVTENIYSMSHDAQRTANSWSEGQKSWQQRSSLQSQAWETQENELSVENF